MNIAPTPDGWIITGISKDVPESDPYGTRAEADSDRIGMKRFERADRRNDTTFILGETHAG